LKTCEQKNQKSSQQAEKSVW